MDIVVDFYNIISPLVPPHRFCVDMDIPLNGRNHPVCPKSGTRHDIVAGIRRNGTELEPFFSKEEHFKSLPKNNLNVTIMLILCILLLWKLYH